MNALRHTILGLFFFVAMAALGFVTIYLGDVTTSALRTTLVAYFDDASGLGAGDPVMVHGVQIGRVTEVVFTPGAPPPERRLRVTFVVDAQVGLREDYEVLIGSTGLLGGKQIDLLTGTGAPLAAGLERELAGKSEPNLMRALSGVFDENRGDVRRIVASLANLAQDLDTGKRSLVDVAFAPDAARSLNDTISAARGFFRNGEQLLADAREQPGPLRTLVYDGNVAEQLRRGVAGFAATADRLGRGEGLLGRLTTTESDPTWEELRAGVASGRRLLDDAAVIASDLRAGRGAIGRLLNDPELEQALADAVRRFGGITADAAALLDAARRGSGVLGLLLADDDARRNVERIIDQIGRAIEDAREAAPVSSVASFLFGQL